MSGAPTEPGPNSNPIAVPSGGLKVSWGLGFIGCLSALMCIAAAILVPFWKSAGSSYETTQCMGNLRRIGRAVMLYAPDNNGLLPGDGWQRDLAKYEPDEVAFACPHQRRVDPGSSGYALNKAVAGKKLDEIQNPEETYLVFDSRPTVPGSIADSKAVPRPGRHRNGRVNNVVYADGRVNSVPAD